MAGITGKSAYGKLDDGATGKKIEPYYITAQPIGSNRIGLDVVAMMAYAYASAQTAGAGSTDQRIQLVAHGARVGDIVVFLSGTQLEFEVHIARIIDANNFELGSICSASLVGSTFDLLRPKTPKVDISGATLATVSPSPLIYTRNGVNQVVTEDTVTPSNTVALPVKIVAVGGTNVTLTAGDINIQTSHIGASADSMQIGDGVEIALITAAGELNVISTSANTKADALLAELQLKADLTETQPVSLASLPLPTGGATSANQTSELTKLDTLIAKDFSTAAHQVSHNTKLDSLIAKDFSTEATLAALLVKFNSLGQKTMANSAPVVIASDQLALPVSAASLPLPAGASTSAIQVTQQTALDAINGKLPSSIGQKSQALSLAVVLPSDQPALAITQAAQTAEFVEATVTTAQTLVAPAGTFMALIMTDETNTTNLRVKQGAVATASSGMQFQPGRSEGFEAGTDISVCAESGSCKVMVQWFKR